MGWFTSNWIWIGLIGAMVAMHLRHGGHGGHGLAGWTIAITTCEVELQTAQRSFGHG